RHRLLNLAPVARAALIERLEDRILVFDDDHRLVDCNQAAATTLSLPQAGGFGRRASDILGAWPELAALVPALRNQRIEVKIGEAIFEASLFAVLGDEKDSARTRVLVLSDITRLK